MPTSIPDSSSSILSSTEIFTATRFVIASHQNKGAAPPILTTMTATTTEGMNNNSQSISSTAISPIVYVVSVGAAVLILALAGFALYIRTTNRNEAEPDHELQMDDLNDIGNKTNGPSSENTC
ncbi:hypothetical protein BDR26DRAFT_940747 [Obelidium mucronatum]|nr:hypothetical protein BDR26DRAFT_940747 [Obelidium mucronatum]